ncbi:MAG: CFI-box-CTERM domain-containing protein [Candidatus Hydromicrobium sp.]
MYKKKCLNIRLSSLITHHNILAYMSYISKIFDKIRKIVVVLANQISDLNNIWDNFSENKGNYSNIQELKNKCKEIIKTVDMIENEEEELISINPPNNLIGLHTATINIYNPIFKSFFEILNKLYLIINNPEDPRLEKFFKNGKQCVKLDSIISIDEESKIFSRELKKATRELQKFNKAKGKRCYIATVVYKDVNAPEVMKLRQWRDDVLCNNVFGKLIIEIYYFSGKYFANWINKVPFLKRIIKYFLDLFISKLVK